MHAGTHARTWAGSSRKPCGGMWAGLGGNAPLGNWGGRQGHGCSQNIFNLFCFGDSSITMKSSEKGNRLTSGFAGGLLLQVNIWELAKSSEPIPLAVMGLLVLFSLLS